MSSSSTRNLTSELVRRLPDQLTERGRRLAGSSPAFRRLARTATAGMREGDQQITGGPGAGLAMNLFGSRPSYLLGTAESGIVELLEATLAPGDEMLDLGANVGYISLIAGKLVGPAGRVVAVEPIPQNADALRHNFLINEMDQCSVLEVAVDEHDGTARLSIGESDQDATLLAVADAQTIEVATLAVDSIVAQGALRPKLIKIDVEGLEDAVVRGMKHTIAAHRPITIVELHTDAPTLSDPIPEFFVQRGYRVRLMPNTPGEPLGWASHLIAEPA